jgi:hypothetical protein
MEVSRTLLLALTLAISLGLNGCFLGSILPSSTEKKTKSVGGSSPTPVEPEEKSISAGRVSDIKLLRRISLDLTGKLPTVTDVTTVTGSTNLITKFLETYLASSATSRYLASIHKIMWKFDNSHMQDLEDFITYSGGLTAATMTDELREQITYEPLMMLRYGFEQDMTFSDIFKLDYGIVHSDNLTFWDQTSDGTPWSGEPWRFATYKDSRADGGPLVTNGMIAHLSAGRNTTNRSLGAKALDRLLCSPFDALSKHTFAEVTSANLSTDLSTVAITESPCVACHDHFKEFGKTLDGLAEGATLTAWYTGAAPADPSATYAGHTVATAADSYVNIGKDPRLHRCEVKRIIETIMQKPIASVDDPTFALAMRTFYENDEDLVSALRPILESPEYSYAPADKKVTSVHLRQSTGVKFLNEIQWATILSGLGSTASALTVPESLTPGFDETVFKNNGIPGGAYWHHTARLARQVATAIVTDELSDSILPASRILLQNIPEGSGKGISTATAIAQLSVVWQRLTGTELDTTTDKYDRLVDLWEASLDSGTDDDSYRQAWRAVLTAAFSDYDFISY